MNAFKVTYTDGTHYTTNANGTAEEFEAYLTQFGRRICTYENPETGAETFRTIEKVEDVTLLHELADQLESCASMLNSMGYPLYYLSAKAKIQQARQ